MKKKISGIFLFLLTPCVVLVFPLLSGFSSYNYAPLVDQFSSLSDENLLRESSFVVYAGYVGCAEECIVTLKTLQEIENTLGENVFQKQNVYFINLFEDISNAEAQRYVDRFVGGVTVLNLNHQVDNWLEQLHINHSQPVATSEGLEIDHPNLFYHFLRTEKRWKMERLSHSHLINRLSN